MEQYDELSMTNSLHRLQADKKIIDNILQLNDDCLIEIFRYLSLIQLCKVAETCTRLQYVAGKTFSLGNHSYGIPRDGVKFKHQQRILRNFGHLLTHVGVINFNGLGEMSWNKMKRAFKWLDAYCTNTLESLTIFKVDNVDLPPAAMRLMSEMQKIELYSPISENYVRAAFKNCPQLTELNMGMYDGPFHFGGLRLPSLKKLAHRVRVDSNTDFKEIETFFQNHSELIALSTQFLGAEAYRESIDLSYIKHLIDLQKLNLILDRGRIIGTDAFTNLNKLKEFSFDSSSDAKTDIAILESLASVDSLIKLEFGIPKVDHLISCIGRFKNLSELTITQDTSRHRFDVNISCLSQLRNSRLTSLKISCMKLLEPNGIVAVVRNLNEIKSLELSCEVELSETISKNLAAVCSSQRRKIYIIIFESLMEEMNFNFNFIDKFNSEHGQYVQIKKEHTVP